MPDESYFALPHVSNSYLSRLAKCPANALIEIEQTPSMSLGSAAHCIILEGKEVFESRFIIAPECDRRTKIGKQIWKDTMDNRGDKTVIPHKQLKALVGMAQSIANHPSAREYLSEGEAEMAFTWEEEGVDLKGKADWLSRYLIDLKSCQDSSEYVFARTIINMKYHKQMAMYRNGLGANSVWPDACLIIAVENSAPYTCNIFELSEDLLEKGEGEYRELLRKHKACTEANSWPAYTNAGVILVDCPAWMKEVKF